MNLSNTYWSSGFILSVVLSISLAQENTLAEQQKNHRLKTLSPDEYKKVAEISDSYRRRYFKDVILKPLLTVRVSGTEGNKQVQKHITAFMEHLQWTVEQDTFTDTTPYGEKEFTNIIATHNPNALRKLVLSCHFDSKYFENIEFVGATDAAVPCAMMLDLALRLNSALNSESNGMAHNVSLQLIFFDGNEAFKHWTDTDSLYGARHLASKLNNMIIPVDGKAPVNGLQTMDAMLLLNLIGTKTSTFRNWFSQTSNLFERLQNIEMILAKADMLLPQSAFTDKRSHTYFVGSSPMGGGIQDDHVPFLDRGVPVLHLISYPFPDVWHNPSDNERALDYDTTDNLGRILRVLVAEYLHLAP